MVDDHRSSKRPAVANQGSHPIVKNSKLRAAPDRPAGLARSQCATFDWIPTGDDQPHAYLRSQNIRQRTGECKWQAAGSQLIERGECVLPFHLEM